MAGIKERPSVREVTVLVPGDGDRLSERSGADLNDVLRAILWDLRDDYGWKDWTAAAKALGLPQSSLSSFFQEEKVKNPDGSTTVERQGTRLETLSRICAAIRKDPIELFQRHERYAEEKRFADDAIFDQFRTVLDRGEAARLLPVLVTLKARGALDLALQTMERIAGIERDTQKEQATARKRSTPRKKRSGKRKTG